MILKKIRFVLISIKQLHYIHSKIAFLENKVKCLESNAHKKDNNSYCGCNELYTLSTHHSNVNKKEISIPFQQRDNSCFNESIQEIDLTELKASNKTQLTEEDYCKIILKKDYIISQLKRTINNIDKNNEINRNVFNTYKEEINSLKKENEELQNRYSCEFELVASAMYSIGTAMLAIKKDIKFEYNSNTKRTFLTKAKLNLINDNNLNNISY